MNFKIKKFIFTDKKKDGTDLINKSGNKFFMLHLEGELKIGDTETKTIFASKFYTNDSKLESLKEKIKIGEKYILNLKQSGMYYNIVNLHTKEGIIII